MVWCVCFGFRQVKSSREEERDERGGANVFGLMLEIVGRWSSIGFGAPICFENVKVVCGEVVEESALGVTGRSHGKNSKSMGICGKAGIDGLNLKRDCCGKAIVGGARVVKPCWQSVCVRVRVSTLVKNGQLVEKRQLNGIDVLLEEFLVQFVSVWPSQHLWCALVLQTRSQSALHSGAVLHQQM